MKSCRNGSCWGRECAVCFGAAGDGQRGGPCSWQPCSREILSLPPVGDRPIRALSEIQLPRRRLEHSCCPLPALLLPVSCQPLAFLSFFSLLPQSLKGGLTSSRRVARLTGGLADPQMRADSGAQRVCMASGMGWLPNAELWDQAFPKCIGIVHRTWEIVR